MGNEHSEAKMSSKTVLGPDCRINGELVLDNDAVIMGQFKGTLRISGLLELTDSAKVGGTIVAGMLRVAGHTNADIAAEGGVELLPGASVEGRIYSTQVHVAEGASFQGEVCIGPNAMQAAGQSVDAAAAAPEPEPFDAGDSSMDHGRDDHDEESNGNGNGNAGPVRTMSSNVSSILQRRRAKVLTSGSPLRPNGM